MLDPAVSKSIEYVFGERNPLAVYMKAEQFAFWCTIEDKTALYERGLGNQHLHLRHKLIVEQEVSNQFSSLAKAAVESGLIQECAPCRTLPFQQLHRNPVDQVI